MRLPALPATASGTILLEEEPIRAWTPLDIRAQRAG
jgi:hypothetical protein